MRPRVLLRVGAAPPAAQDLPLTGLRLSRSLAWPVGQAEAILPPGASMPAAGDKVTITGASDGDTLEPLMTGLVLRARPGSWQSVLLIEEFTGPLTRLHEEKAVTGTNAADVIKNLCQAAGLQTVSTEPPGAMLPFLALTRGPSALEQILKLAFMSGQMARPSADGTLTVGMPPLTPGAVQLRPQDPVLDFRVEDSDPDPGPKLSGDGAQGGKGPGAEHWLLQDLGGITAGDGAPRHVAGLKAVADVTKAAQIAGTLRKEAAHLRVLTLAGIPPADLGDVITLTGFPDGNGPARICAVDLVYGAGVGLVTTLELHGLGV